MKARKRNRRSGFTVIEIVLASALFGIVAFKAHSAMQTASKSMTTESQLAVMEDQAQRVLKQVAFAVMSSSRESLDPSVGGYMSTDSLKFQINLGIQDGEVVWSDPEKVAMDQEDLWVYWSQNPDEAAEKKVIWTNLVAPYLEGEIPNGIDDNGNGVIDETGLSFSINGNAVTIRLTLERVLDDGTSITNTVSTVVTCRNLED